MDLDAYVALHRPAWQRLEVLVRQASRPRRLSGAELDELVDLYQRAATHLSVVRTRSPDPGLVDALSGLVTRARSAVAGARDPGWRHAGRFLVSTFPAAVYVRRWWVLATAAACCAVAVGLGVWIANDPVAARSLVPPEQVQALCEREFEQYYKSAPAASFAAQVWTNNAWVAAGAISFGALLGIPTAFVLLLNSVNVGVAGGYMATCGKADQFFTLILPHGLLELTAVFVAGAVGLRLGWRVIDPGPRRRADALAEEGREAVGIALGLVAVLAVSGLIEGFVTPSPLPPAARLAIGTLAWLAFCVGVAVLGRRALAAGVRGDLPSGDVAARAPVAA